MLVPTIDLKAAEEDVTALRPLDASCRDHGFFLLRNHGMDAAIEQMWQAASGIFEQSSEVKREVVCTVIIKLKYFNKCKCIIIFW
mgnify:CR=1 FL=1